MLGILTKSILIGHYRHIPPPHVEDKNMPPVVYMCMYIHGCIGNHKAVVGVPTNVKGHMLHVPVPTNTSLPPQAVPPPLVVPKPTVPWHLQPCTIQQDATEGDCSRTVECHQSRANGALTNAKKQETVEQPVHCDHPATHMHVRCTCSTSCTRVGLETVQVAKQS